MDHNGRMQIELRPVNDHELKDFLETTERTFGHFLREEEVPLWRKLLPLERSLVAIDGSSFVATAGAFPFSLSVPGGEVAAAGVTIVGVLPSHRRRGILTAMMERQLHETHERGEPLAVLFASEGGIYHRYGYGLGVIAMRYDVDRDRARFRDGTPRTGRTRMLEIDEAVGTFNDVYERVRRTTSGMYARSSDWWRMHRFYDPEYQRDGAGPQFRAVWEDEDGTPGAYVLYRIHGSWDDGVPKSKLEVLEVAATSPVATREIWSFIFGVDLIDRVQTTWQPLDDPLIHMLEEPRRLQARLGDALWVRVVDAEVALAARSYRASGPLVLEVADDLCPWNAGRWAIESDGSQSGVEKTAADPDLALGARELGAVYLGGVSFRSLALAERMDELTEGAVERADAMFRTERAPWSPEVF